MLTLKETMAKDVDMFFNVNEFAEEHQINNETLYIIVDEHKLTEQKLKSKDGTYEGDILFYARKSDFSGIPIVGRSLKYDGKKAEITDVLNEGDVFGITIKMVRA